MSDTALTDLRDITEEADLDCILKPNIGGYTKKSVLDYLAYLKKQQQDLRDSFGVELGRLQAEKEAWQTEKAGLLAEIKKLKEEQTLLDADLDEALTRIREDEEAMKQGQDALDEEKRKNEALTKSADDYRIRLDEACARNDELNMALADIDTTKVTVRRPAELSSSMPSEEETEKASEKLQELLLNAASLREEMTRRTEELGEQMQTLNDLTSAQMQSSRKAFAELEGELQNSLDLNALLESEKDGLSKRVSELMEENLALGRENSRLKAAGLILQHRLDSAPTTGTV